MHTHAQAARGGLARQSCKGSVRALRPSRTSALMLCLAGRAIATAKPPHTAQIEADPHTRTSRRPDLPGFRTLLRVACLFESGSPRRARRRPAASAEARAYPLDGCCKRAKYRPRPPRAATWLRDLARLSLFARSAGLVRAGAQTAGHRGCRYAYDGRSFARNGLGRWGNRSACAPAIPQVRTPDRSSSAQSDGASPKGHKADRPEKPRLFGHLTAELRVPRSP